MTNAATARAGSLDWLRVSAWSGSFAVHIAILLLMVLPMTVPSTRQRAETIVARWIENEPPPRAKPEPPPPQVPHRVRQVQVRTQPPRPVLVTPIAVPAPTLPISDTAKAQSDIADSSMSASDTGSGDIGAGGATEMLAYATPVRPRYPLAAARAREQGTVLLRVLVDENGVPERVEIARSSGHARLDAAARDTVMQARFHPLLRAGQAIAAWGLVPIAFRLEPE
jgi:protein TonB